MANDGQIVFEVTADGKHAIADIKEITRAIQQETGKWDAAAKSSADNIESKFSGMLKKLAAGFSAAKIGKALLDFGKDALQAASDLQEVQNVVDTTFGSNSNQIEAWAKKAGTQFGLTELQAKKFTSTMGAMLKSSGLAGDQIVDVSTDLAGLAADMASFYNLDFEDAFSKIRSGISGMTMPLKELGIDMSVDTLNAFALAQGLEKTFSQMSQSEQTMLRYQYLMQATADAQGDFAKTSDGYANKVRNLQTQLTTLKTAIGNVALDVISPLASAISSLFPESYTSDSLLDRISQARIAKEQKLAEIEEIKINALELIGILEEISTDDNASLTLGRIASSANVLDSTSVSSWNSLLSAFQGINGLDNLFGANADASAIEELSNALAGQSVSMTKAQAWETFLNALADNSDAVSKITGDSASETEEWLRGLAGAAKELSPTDAASWNTLMTSLVKGVDLNTDEGKNFVETLAQNFLAMGNGSDEAVNGLKALGYTTTEIEDKQAAWLRTCKELVSTIPGLSSLINTETGEIKGGIPALKKYADEWERTAKYKAVVDSLKAERSLYNESNNQADLEARARSSRAAVYARYRNKYGDKFTDETRSFLTERISELDQVVQAFVDAGFTSWDQLKSNVFDVKNLFGGDVATGGVYGMGFAVQAGIDPKQIQWINAITGDEEEVFLALAEAMYRAKLNEKELAIATEELDKEIQDASKDLNVSEEDLKKQMEAAEADAEAMTTLQKALNDDETALKEVQTAVVNANEALKNMADYAEQVRNSVRSSIESNINGFGRITTLAEKNTENLTKELEKLGDRTAKNAKEWDQLKEAVEKSKKASSTTSDQQIAENLRLQAEYMDNYLKALNAARENGINAEILAQLSDGSVESYDILSALADAKNVEEINANFQKVTEGKKKLEDEFTSQKLSVDQTFQTLQDKAKEAIAALDLGEEAKENIGKTIQGIADGIGEHASAVQEQVNGIIAQLERLNGFNIDLDFGGFGHIVFTTTAGKAESSGRFGINYVPRDDYLIRAHEGERLLTAQENQIWNTLLNGGYSGFDLDSLGGVMRDNIKPGGNVYLDGKVVGNVISDQQGKSYRSLQRSGWQV